MRLHVLVEGESEARFLRRWLPRLLPSVAFKVYPHQGKGRLPRVGVRLESPPGDGLLDQLVAKLNAFGRSLDPSTDRVVVLVDADTEDCLALKARLLEALDRCPQKPVVLFRIAVEELEAFYLGDVEAVRRAFPASRLHRLKTYIQDSVCGTAELFGAIIGARGMDKVAWAERMAPELGTQWRGAAANRSPSFRQFCAGLHRLSGEA
jgi:Domain of unknown function (DUF4276)